MTPLEKTVCSRLFPMSIEDSEIDNAVYPVKTTTFFDNYSLIIIENTCARFKTISSIYKILKLASDKAVR